VLSKYPKIDNQFIRPKELSSCYYFDKKKTGPQIGKNFMNNEKTKIVRQVTKFDPV